MKNMSENSLSVNTNEFDKDILLNQFFSTFDFFYEEEKLRITNAWNFLCDISSDVSRSCGEPYILHPMRIACILAENRFDVDTIISGLFHNIFALDITLGDKVKNDFGELVFNIVNGTHKISALKIQNKTLQQADAIRKMLFAMSDDVRIIIVKLIDRLDRLRNIDNIEVEKQKKIAQEIIDIWAPLANRLGMSSIKSELEDLSLKYTNPDAYAQVKSVVAAKKNERASYLKNAEKAIQEATSKVGIKVEISSRAKHFYSIYQKMKKRNKSADEIFDLLAMRILCESDSDCYTLIGLVHGLWKPLDGRFKDYIAMPKANGYQSLHTTVMCEGKPLEIQIRTYEMHSVAEHGVASHWLYKKGTNKDSVSIENLSLINQLKDLRKNHIQDEAFFSEIKEDLLGDSIFVFTPQGDVVELPVGSTAIDFAYQIHSAIGEKITGAKANGQIIPLSKPLRNTQIVEILTSPQAHPTSNQLQVAKTAKARSKIRSWLVQNEIGFSDNNLQGNKVSAEFENDTLKKHKKGDGPIPVVAKGTGKIKIGNTTNFLVKKAGCCLPEFGDKIIGYVSRGRGIIIHRADCSVFAKIPNSAAQSLCVEWDSD